VAGGGVSVEFHTNTAIRHLENYVIDYGRPSSYWPIWGGAGFGLAGFSPEFWISAEYDFSF